MFVLGAAIAAPLLSSFADAAAVFAFQHEPRLARPGRTRVFANSLTALSAVPLLIGGTIPDTLQRLRSRIVELLLFGAALLVVTQLVFWGAVIGGATSRTRHPPSVFLLPLFFWGAVRFGAGGISATLLLSTLMACIAAGAGRRPFAILEPRESVIALQTYLLVMAIPSFAAGGAARRAPPGAGRTRLAASIGSAALVGVGQYRGESRAAGSRKRSTRAASASAKRCPPTAR